MCETSCEEDDHWLLYSYSQVTPALPLTAAISTSWSWLQSAARAGAGVALLALPLLAMARPFRTQQQLPLPSPVATIAADGSSQQPSTAAAAGHLVMLNDQLSVEELQQLCSAVEQRVVSRVWLSSKDAGISEAVAARILEGGSSAAAGHDAASQSASKSSSSIGSETELVYQLVVGASGGVLGVTPCSPAAAAAVLELPLTVDLRGSPLDKVQHRWEAAAAAAA